MPPKKRPLFRKPSAAKKMQARRAAETPEERQVRLRTSAERRAKQRQQETSTERQARQRDDAERQAKRRQRETSTERLARLRANAERAAERRQRETSAERQARLRANAERVAKRRQWHRRLQIQIQRQSEREALHAFCWRAVNYNPDEYEGISSMGSMSELCGNCRAKKLPARKSSGKNGGSVSNSKNKSLSQHLSASDIKVEHGNVKKSKQSCSTAVQTQDSQNVFTSGANELCLINGNSNIDSYPQPTLNPTSIQIKKEVPDCCEEILDSNKVVETVNTLSEDKREQASCFYKETESKQTESKTLDCNNVPARILYSSSIEIDQEATDSDNEALQIQILEVNSVAKDISMPQPELNSAFNQEILKEIPDSDGNAQTPAKISCIGVDQNRLQQCNRDIDRTFDLANIKIKEEILDFEEENEVDASLILHDEIEKVIPHSDNVSVPLVSSPDEQVILNNTKNTVRRSKRIAKNINPPSKSKVSDKNCKMCQELNEKYIAEQMKCKDLEQKLKDADLKVLALMEKINRMSEEKMELQKKLSLHS